MKAAPRHREPAFTLPLGCCCRSPPLWEVLLSPSPRSSEWSCSSSFRGPVSLFLFLVVGLHPSNSMIYPLETTTLSAPPTARKVAAATRRERRTAAPPTSGGREWNQLKGGGGKAAPPKRGNSTTQRKEDGESSTTPKVYSSLKDLFPSGAFLPSSVEVAPLQESSRCGTCSRVVLPLGGLPNCRTLTLRQKWTSPEAKHYYPRVC